MDGKMKRMSRDNQEDSMEAAFEQKIKESIYQKMQDKITSEE